MLVDELEAFHGQRRSGGQHGPQRHQIVLLARRDPRGHEGTDVAAVARRRGTRHELPPRSGDRSYTVDCAPSDIRAPALPSELFAPSAALVTEDARAGRSRSLACVGAVPASCCSSDVRAGARMGKSGGAESEDLAGERKNVSQFFGARDPLVPGWTVHYSYFFAVDSSAVILSSQRRWWNLAQLGETSPRMTELKPPRTTAVPM